MSHAAERAPLKLLAGKTRQIGAAVGAKYLQEPLYSKTLASEFSLIVPETETNLEVVHPERDQFDFAPADAICEFARAHGMEVRGHNLVWDVGLPAWVAKLSKDELRDALKEHIQTVIRHFNQKFPGLMRSIAS
ncbi:MAG: endo-1,4-beta-xylanase [Bdellovibrionota bacterium]